MSLAFSQADIVRFKSKADRVISKGRALHEKYQATLSTAITTGEVSASSFLFGLAQGKFGGIEVLGLSVDMLAGIGLHVAGFLGIAGKGSVHLHAFGDGALASYFGGLGRNVGRGIQTPADRERWQHQSRLLQTTSQGAPLDGVTGGASLADEELIRMVAAGK